MSKMKRLISLFLVFNIFSVPNVLSHEYDGADDISCNVDMNAIDTATDLSCHCWVYHDTITTDDSILVKISTEVDNGFYFFRDDVGSASGRTDTYTIAVFDSADADNARIEGISNASSATTWTSVGFSADLGSVSGLRLYINGAEDANSPVSLASISAINASTAGLRVGKSITLGPFDGRIKDCACWTAILTAQEFSILANSRMKRMPMQIQPSSLVFYFPADEFSVGTALDGNNVYDMSGNGNGGTYFDSSNNSGMTATSEEILSYP